MLLIRNGLVQRWDRSRFEDGALPESYANGPDVEGPPFQPSDVLVSDGMITGIGDAGEFDYIALDEATHVELLNAEGMLLFPGLIDTHRHLWQTCFKGICGDRML